MSKVNINTNTEATAEEIAKAEKLYDVKSSTGEFLDVTDNLDEAKNVADSNPGSTVYEDATEEVVYTSQAAPIVEETPAVEEKTEEVAEEASPTEEVVAEEPVKEEVKKTPIKKEEKPKHNKACVQVVAVDDVIKTVEPEVAKVEKIVMPGMQVKLDNKYLYKSAHIPQPFKLVTGAVFIFDAKCINGRYRVTNNVNNCGGDIKNVIGYIPAEYI